MRVCLSLCTDCCRHLGSQLAEMENVIERMMEADLVDYAVQDIRNRLEVSQLAAMPEERATESEVLCLKICIYTFVHT